MSRPEEPGKKTGDSARPGAVTHDTRGNAVWRWAVQTGKHAIDSTSSMLRRLDVPGLSIEDDEALPGKSGPETPAAEPGKRVGYDPYGRSTAPEKPLKPGRAAPPAGTKAPSPPARAPEPRRPSWWSRLFGRR